MLYRTNLAGRSTQQVVVELSRLLALNNNNSQEACCDDDDDGIGKEVYNETGHDKDECLE